MADYLDGCLDAFDLENRYCLVLYETERRWHERLLIRKTSQNRDGRSVGWFVVATPDGDVYADPTWSASASWFVGAKCASV